MKKLISLGIALWLLPALVFGWTETSDELESWRRTDKPLHALSFGLVSTSLYSLEREKFPEGRKWDKEAAKYSCFYSTSMGFAYEVVQGFNPRNGDGFTWRDDIANKAGTVTFSTLAYILNWKAPTWARNSWKWLKDDSWGRFTTSFVVGALLYAEDRNDYPPEAYSNWSCARYASMGMIVAFSLPTEIAKALFIPDQNFSWKKIGIDFVGSSLGILLASLIVNYQTFNYPAFWDIDF